jgi:hypothetical protein
MRSTFFHADSAHVAADGSVTLTGEPATLVCGGPDDQHYDVSSTTEKARVLAGASVEKVTCGTPSGCADEPIPARRLPSYLAAGAESGVFLVTGPLDGITALKEMYHP